MNKVRLGFDHFWRPPSGARHRLQTPNSPTGSTTLIGVDETNKGDYDGGGRFWESHLTRSCRDGRYGAATTPDANSG